MDDSINEDNDDKELLELIPYSIRGYTEIEDTDQVCSICLDQGCTIKLTDCKHCFHLDCIENWKNTTNTCPVCRIPIPENTQRILELITDEITSKVLKTFRETITDTNISSLTDEERDNLFYIIFTKCFIETLGGEYE